MIIKCCIVTKSNSIFFKSNLASTYYITSSLCMLILWNKMYQEFCCYSHLHEEKKRWATILSTAAAELEFYNGRQSFLAIKIHVGNSHLDSHLFNEFLWITIKNFFWIASKFKYWKLWLKIVLVVFQKFCWSRLSFKTQFKIEFLLQFSGSRNPLKVML